jgi:hypothetical protein
MKVWQVLWRLTRLLHDISIWYRSVEPISNLADCFETASKKRRPPPRNTLKLIHENVQYPSDKWNGT